jgi:hypothetical protein
MYAASVCFGLVLAALEFHRIYVCNSTVSWHHNQTAECYLGDAIGIISLCSMTIGIISVPLLILIEVF